MPYLSLLVLAAVYVAAVAAWQLPLWAGLPYLIASLVCFAAYGLDKAAARAGRRRTSERSLLLLGFACGWPGAVLAQQWFRHKTGKRPFQIAFWCTALCNLGLFIYLGSPASFIRLL